MKSKQPEVLSAPLKPTGIPESCRWLSGEGCGSWFGLEIIADGFVFTRYSDKGNIECRGIFRQQEGREFDPMADYKYTYLSHCSEVKIIQHKEILKFGLIRKV